MKIRRVVTGQDQEGHSIIKWDDELIASPIRPGAEAKVMWATKDLPAKLSEEDPANWELGTSLSNGSVFRIIRYKPGVSGRWHATDTVDYTIVLLGELWMQLDEGEVHLRTGDVVIQRGTNHNWVNRGTQACIVAFVLIATEGGKSTGW